MYHFPNNNKKASQDQTLFINVGQALLHYMKPYRYPIIPLSLFLFLKVVIINTIINIIIMIIMVIINNNNNNNNNSVHENSS